MSRIRAAGAVAAVLVASVLAPVDAASAQTATIVDGSNDTWQAFWDPTTDARDHVAAGSAPNADVTRMTVNHSREQVTVTVKYAALRKDDTHKPGIHEWFRLDDGGGAVLTLWVDDSWSHPEVFLKHRPVDVPRASRQRARCSGVKSRFNFDRDTWTTKLPTSCLGNPRWVQVHGDVDAGAGGENGVVQTYFQDNPHSDAYEDPLIGSTLACFSQCEGWTGKLRRTR